MSIIAIFIFVCPLGDCLDVFCECYGDHRDLHVLTHSFPTRRSSDLLVGGIRDLLEEHGHAPEIWVTETGYSTWRWDEARQVDRFLDAGAAPAEIGRAHV